MIQLLFLISLSFFYSADPKASPIPVGQAGFEKANHYLTRGVLVGGFEHGEQTLVSVRKNFDHDSKVERVVIELESQVHLKKPQRPGFFHFSIQKSNNRFLLDLHNVVQEKFPAAKIEKFFLDSHYFKEARVFKDVHTRNWTLELQIKDSFREKLKAEIFEMSDLEKPSRIVIDTKEL